MDDHLFVNLRTVRSLLVTESRGRDMKISYFPAFFFFFFVLFPMNQLVAHFTVIWATEDRDVPGAGAGSYRSGNRGPRTCDAISGTFLCLWQMRVFSPLSWPQHLRLQTRPPLPTLPRPRVLATVTFKVFRLREATRSSPRPSPSARFSAFSLLLAKSIAL